MIEWSFFSFPPGFPPTARNTLTQLIIPARAHESTTTLVYCNWWQVNNTVPGEGKFPDFLTFYGQSAVADAGGNLLFTGTAYGGTQENVVIPFGVPYPTPRNTAVSLFAADVAQYMSFCPATVCPSPTTPGTTAYIVVIVVLASVVVALAYRLYQVTRELQRENGGGVQQPYMSI
jgi:hypothetical protein